MESKNLENQLETAKVQLGMCKSRYDNNPNETTEFKYKEAKTIKEDIEFLIELVKDKMEQRL